MSEKFDTLGRKLPAIETPSQETLRVYGDFMFLAFRSVWHAPMSAANLRASFEPPIALNQYRIFRFDGVPRGMLTWAWLNPETERKYVSGEVFDPQDWNSGDRLWLLDFVAPYKGIGRSMMRWMMVPGNFAEQKFTYRRMAREGATRRIVHIDFSRPDDKAQILSDEDFLT